MPPLEADAPGGAAAAAPPAAAAAAAAAAVAAAAAAPPEKPDLYLIVYNVAKKHNIGTLLRCASAFGVRAVCLAGSRHFSTHGAHGADAHVAMLHFPTLEACVAELKGACRCRVLGVEIADGAVPVHSAAAFAGATALMLGNEGAGLSARQAAACDGFVYIPQYGRGTASLNVAVAAGIALHSFCVWAGYAEAPRAGAKFVVGPRPPRPPGAARGRAPPPAAELEALRAARRGGGGEGGDGEAWGGDLFDDERGGPAGAGGGVDGGAKCD